jgi:DNA-directed RNA polymerase I, II, and III subunit RPABC2
MSDSEYSGGASDVDSDSEDSYNGGALMTKKPINSFKIGGQIVVGKGPLLGGSKDNPGNGDDDDDEEPEPLDDLDDENSEVESIPDSDDDIEVDEPEDNGEETIKTKKDKSSTAAKTPIFKPVSNIGSDDDDDDDEDEHYLQKFDKDVNKNYIAEFHPECVAHNYEEVLALCLVVRDKAGNIIDDLHKTSPFLTKYEKTRVLGQRAKQINSGARAFVKVPPNVIDGYVIAEIELREKRIPFIIRRPTPGGGCEYWYLRDLENIHF